MSEKRICGNCGQSVSDKLGTCEYSSIHSETPHYFEDETCINWREQPAQGDPLIPAPKIGGNSVTYREKVGEMEAEPQKCPTCNGYHLGGCHRKAHPEGGETCPSCGRATVHTVTATNFNGCVTCGQPWELAPSEGMSKHEHFWSSYIRTCLVCGSLERLEEKKA